MPGITVSSGKYYIINAIVYIESYSFTIDVQGSNFNEVSENFRDGYGRTVVMNGFMLDYVAENIRKIINSLEGIHYEVYSPQ